VIDFGRWRCRSLRVALVDLAEGTLDAAERGRVERHLSDCRDCSEELAALRAAPRVLQRTIIEKDEASSARQRAKIMERVRELPVTRPIPHRPAARPASAPFPRSALFAAATAGFIALVGYYRFQETFRPSVQLAGSDTPVPNDIEALDAATVLALADLAEVIAPAELHSAVVIDDLSGADLEILDAWLDGEDTLEMNEGGKA